MTENELYHYGIKGMKWGVKHYRSKGGSLLKSGLKRFDKSMADYDNANERYKNAKSAYKNAKKQGLTDTKYKTEVTNARINRKNAKTRLNKDYAHLRLDQLADEGKELYSKNKRITSSAKFTSVLSTVSALSMSAAAYNYKNGTLGNKKVTTFLTALGLGSGLLAATKTAKDEHEAKRLRAYYTHTSKY